MRHFDTWVLRDPYSIWHYYPTGHRWRDTVRDLIHTRAICSPSSEDIDLKRTTPIDPCTKQTNQESSPLLRLPAEIRLLIWSYVLTDTDTPERNPQTVHLVQIKGKIRHVRCWQSSESISASASASTSTSTASSPKTKPLQTRTCCPTTPAHWRHTPSLPIPIANPNPSSQPQPQPSNPNQTPTPQTTRLLYPHTHPSLPNTLTTLTPALLRTCRKIYQEAEPILYKHTLFDVDDLFTFIAFATSLSPPSPSLHLKTERPMDAHLDPDGRPRPSRQHLCSYAQ
ncbi:uncharacterized protein N7511_005326 [Penicillium nucicola]|uniref:uncharacterized protein n=1 Tax=Penicillium nucicola TaxID=1850975 RepID=UPI0025455650|nr:uncharacterized protein N7511_005326 [Penicillium nucicola]KAJ5761944.1 hypothetical protein N7511_005326 [Penicillium nucicola]